MEIIDPGHRYRVHDVEADTSQEISFIKKEEQDGKLVKVGEGTTTEAVLNVVANRLKVLYERLPDPYTKAARYFIGQALGALTERTADRRERGVEGTRKA